MANRSCAEAIKPLIFNHGLHGFHGWGRRTEDRRQRMEDGGRRSENEGGNLIIECTVAGGPFDELRAPSWSRGCQPGVCPGQSPGKGIVKT